MGVDTSIWRARIGMFSGNHKPFKTSFATGPKMPFMFARFIPSMLLLSTLLLIGCVERNPGPEQLKCPTCNVSFTRPANYGDHQDIHAASKNFTFPCCFCEVEFTSSRAFQVHFSRVHEKINSRPSTAANTTTFVDVLQSAEFLCNVPTCQEKLRSFRDLRLHLVDHLKKGYAIRCPFQQCQNNFMKVTTFRTHLSQYHRGEDLNMNTAETGGNIQHAEDGFTIPHDFQNYSGDEADECLDRGDDSDSQSEPEETVPELDESRDDVYPDYFVRNHLVKFYLMLEGDLVLPTTKVQRISEAIAVLLKISHQQIKTALKNEMAKEGIDEECRKKIIDLALKKDIVYNAHHKNMDILNLTTDYMRKKEFKNRTALLEAETIYLGVGDDKKKKYAHYISIEDTLQVMLQDPSVQEQLEESFRREPEEDVLRDYTDGAIYTQHPLCSSLETIQLILYQDAFEFFPISVTAGLYKCVGFYLMLGNVDASKRSKVDGIQLTFLVTDKDLQKFTPEKCLEKLIAELKTLCERGIPFKDKILPVVLMCVSGDNLGQNYIGKFITCFTADFHCRFCEITRAQIRQEPSIIMPLRTPEEYDETAALVPSLDYPVRGIKGNSVLNSIPFFHVCNPGLPPCISHDILEGFAKEDYALFLRYFIEVKKWFTLQQVNDRIHNFKAKGRDAADSFAKLEQPLKKIRGHASEVWLFIRMLPFLIGDMIEDDYDPVWVLCIQLKTICEYVFAPRITKRQVAKLKELSRLYVEERARIFTKELLPKHHYLLHYADLIFWFGPLIRLWTMRFESRHVFFKKAAKAANNFINITKTLSEKYVLNFAYKFTYKLFASKILFRDEDLKVIDIEDFVPEVVNAISADTSFDRSLKKVIVDGIELRPGLWIITNRSVGKNLLVGEIVLILFNGKQLQLILKIHEAQNTLQGYFRIEEENTHIEARSLKDLEEFYPHSAYNFAGHRCISLKHSMTFMD